ncbi:MAG: SUMF1/EgtB/PvdO family nonheme iron enzyme, partial [Myxococcales bacterium]|nr:SUMF1/EgtB/PvdO family nonheme iron enzyme [Myxococcales bacterium]
EVLVMDWGVAKVAGQSLVEGPADEAPVSLSSSGGTGTLQGAIVGTPGYMPPEQARGEVEAVDARSDVWALGALLYELLTGERPVAGKTALAMLIATVQGDIEPPSARAPQRAVPADLEEICLKALAAAPADRYPSARALHADLEQYLAGTREQARRREDADRLVADGDESLWYIRTLEAELAELDARLASLPPLTGQEPQDTKRERWATEDRVEHLRAELDRAFHYARGKFLQATERVSDHGDARARLSDLHWTRYRAARAAAEHREAEDHLKAVGRFQDPRYVQRLRREVPLTLRSDPPGARVTLHRVGERDRVLTPDAGRVLGHTPLVGVPLPTGRHLLVLEVPGRRPVRLPLLVWPGDEPDFHVPIPPDEVLGDDFVYVPAGHFVRGNDPHAVLANPGGLVHLDAFAIQRFPVTVGEYFAFLDALPPEQAARHQPREPRVGPLFPPPPDGRWRAPMVDLDGDPWPADWAIFSISFHDAEAYAAWRSLRDGQRYRLPTEDEWEKAARGTDGRRFPWGDHFHPTFCSNRTAVPGHVMPRPVGHFATDCSPYGVRDMAGGVREWTDAWFEEGQRVIRGGAFSLYPFLCRVAGRWGAGPHTTQPNYGFRLVKSLN